MTQSTAIENVKNAVVKAEKRQQMSINEIISAQIKELKRCLPADMSPERLCRIALTCFRNTPKLADCTTESFIAALFQSAQLGLEPGVGGEAYLIPYGRKVNFQIGYQGLVKLYYRHEHASTLTVEKVCKNDVFEYEMGTDAKIKHVPNLDERGETIAFYAVATMKDGNKIIKIMSKKECMAHGKKHSKSFSREDSCWQTDPDAMCKKTVLIQILKTMPKSIEIQKALAMDNTTKSTVIEDMSLVKDETDWSKEEAA